MSNWISVEEGSPKEDCKVLAFSSYGVGCAWWCSWGGIFQDCNTNDDEGMIGTYDDVEFIVTHWMPLPEPPTE